MTGLQGLMRMAFASRLDVVYQSLDERMDVAASPLRPASAQLPPVGAALA